MMTTTLLFARNIGPDLIAFAAVTFTSEQTQDPKVLIEKFKNAVTICA